MIDIDLASFSFDTSDIVKGAAEIKKNIDDIKAAQKELTKSGQESSEEFIQNAADLRTLNGYYREHIKYLSDSSKGAFDAATREAQLELVLGQEATTIKELRDQNKLLNKLRNDTNVLTEEGQAELKLLNDQLDANNALIKENVDQYTQQKIGIGDYAGGIKSALAEMNPFNVSLTVFIQNAQEAGGVLPLLSKGFTALRAGIVGITKASLAFIATPIGAVIAALGLALGAVVKYFTSTQAGIDKVTAVTRPLMAIFESLIGVVQNLGGKLVDAFSNPKKLLEDLADFVKTNLINRFKAFGVILDGIINLDFKKVADGVLQAGTGVENLTDKIANGAKETSNFLSEAIDKGKELDRLEKELERTRINNTIEIGKATEAFKAQNKIAEDTNKTLAEREAAVKESIVAAQRINALKQQELDIEIAILKNKQSRNDTSREEEQALAELIAKKNELNAQELEQTTTQQNKLNTIRREANARAIAEQQKQTDESLKKEKERIELFEQEMKGFKAQTLQEELDAERAISDMKLALLQRELEAKKISQEQYAKEVLSISQDLARAEAEVKVETASKEIEAYRRAFEEQQEERRFLSDQVLADKINELNALLEQEKAFAQLKLEQGLIDKQEYDDAIFELSEANRLAIKEITDEREAVEKEEAEELRALAFEEELQRLMDEGATKYEIQRAQLDEQYANDKAALDASLKNQEISQELYNAKLESLTRQRATAESQIEQTLAEEKLALAGGLLSQLSGLIDKQSAAGKAIAIAQAGINTFQGITEGLKAPFPLNIAMPILAAATGFAAVKKIVSTKVPSASGGGSVGASSGGGFSANFAQNLTGNAPLTASTNANVQDQVETTANQTDTTAGIADAVQQGAQAGTQQGSQEGITNLSSNRQIMEQSSF